MGCSAVSDLEARVAMLERIVAQQARQLRTPIAFGRSTAAPIDTGPVQTIQGQMDALSRRDGMPVLFHYGYSSAMPIGGDKVISYLTADRSQGVVIATGHQSYRLTGLSTGQVALYDMWGHKIVLGSGGISMTGTVSVTGDIHATGAVIAGYGGADQVGLQTHHHGTGGVPPAAGT